MCLCCLYCVCVSAEAHTWPVVGSVSSGGCTDHSPERGNRLHLTKDTDWLVRVATVRNFRVNELCVPRAKATLPFSSVHVYLNLHQLVACCGLRLLLLYKVSKIVWLMLWVYSCNQPRTDGQLFWRLASPIWSLIWILLSMLSYLTAVADDLSWALYYTLWGSMSNRLLMGNILTPPTAVSELSTSSMGVHYLYITTFPISCNNVSTKRSGETFFIQSGNLVRMWAILIKH